MPDPKDTKTEEKPPVNEEITKVLEELKSATEKLKAPVEEKPAAPVSPTYADRREALQKSLGYTNEQMAAHEEMILRAQAPVIERTAWSAIEKKSDLDTYRGEIEKELAMYPQERRTPEIMEKIYYYVKGKHADSKPAPTKETKPNPVERTRVTGGPGYTGQEPGMGGGSETKPGEEEMQLNDQEKFVASKLGITESEYAKSRNVGKEIRGLRMPDERPVNSLADVELRRMTGKR